MTNPLANKRTVESNRTITAKTISNAARKKETLGGGECWRFKERTPNQGNLRIAQVQHPA